ncbi:MAG: cell division protein ZipA C-terminal FtsZ-binding domain-containing protein [Gammaproteobacteria bacterium]
MDASALRWVLAIVGIVLLVGIYLFSQHQSRLRKRVAMQTFAREEIDSAFIEDEQLREELENLNQIMQETNTHESFEQIKINPAIEADLAPRKLPAVDLFVAEAVAAVDQENLISYLLRHPDNRLITGEEIESAVRHTGFEMNDDGLLEMRQQDELCFSVTSLSAPGDFCDMGALDFTTLGLQCFIDLDSNATPRHSYEVLLKKIDELVRILNVKVFESDNELLTISNVTRVREKLAS